MWSTALAVSSLLVWSLVIILPWRSWSTRERLDSSAATTLDAAQDLSDITVLIPARDEADTIAAVLESVYRQGEGLHVVLVDDQSSDATRDVASTFEDRGLQIISGAPLPDGWAGKLWALEQGRQYLKTPYTLLLDADIRLTPGILATLRDKAMTEGLQFISLMARLRMQTFWERLLLPAFIYFFKMMYPFRLSNNPRFKRIAAAAGGCILLETSALQQIGGFASVRNALIDDCALAARIKAAGFHTWIGLTHSIISMRPYDRLGTIWNMVARSAYTQLHYSIMLLLLTTAVFFIVFFWPLAGLFSLKTDVIIYCVVAILLMMAAYIPILRYYRVPVYYAIMMPFIGSLFLAMTWTSALRYWSGRRSLWKGRVYNKTLGSG
ncbi:MAG: glycosyltransferase [Gammaproteobacteria bacterium]|nr:MAG: glycosyltransferase [Gammaproteobacteria bacterium]